MALQSLDVSFGVVLIIMTVVYIILGMLMDELPMIMLTVPIFLPIVESYGVNFIWFGIYIILVMELGAIAPPVGLNCFIIQGIAKDIPLSKIYKGALPFVITILDRDHPDLLLPADSHVPSELTVRRSRR